MGFFSETTRVVEIDAKNSVTIRRLTFGERQKILSLATKVSVDVKRKKPGSGDDEENEQSVTLDTALLQLEQVKAAIVSWSGPGFEGRSVTAENVEALPSFVVDRVAWELDELMKGLDENEKKPLTGPSSS